MPMIKLPAESNVLAGHVVVGCRHVPCFKRIAGIFREVRRARSGSSAVDGRQQHQITSGIVYFASSEREPFPVFVKPPAVVNHVAEKALLVRCNLFCGISLVRRAIHAPATLTACIARQAKSHLVEEVFGVVVVLNFKAIVAVITGTGRDAECVLTGTVIVGKH